MGNIVDYVAEYGGYSFLERPFSDADSLVIAQFAYLKLEGVVPEPGEERPGVTIGEIAHKKEREAIFADGRFAADNAALFDAMRKSRRFQTMKINDCVNRIDQQEQLQFFAVTCFLEDDSVYLAFRGTDETLVGWKEDFYMACKIPVRSQELSVSYVEAAAGRCRGRLILGGHSKGGNLAVYAAMHCTESVRKRIRGIYNLDGPGFLPRLRNADIWRMIEGRVHKIIPHSSLIGMLLEDTDDYMVVESSVIGVLQHNPFSWLIRDGKFVEAKEVYKSRKAAMEVLNQWIISIPEEERADFVDYLFAIVEASEAETLLDFSGNWKTAAKRMASALRDTDRETRRELWRIAGALLAAGKAVAAAHIRRAQDAAHGTKIKSLQTGDSVKGIEEPRLQ